jgi:prenyltransferase beta subunit
LKNKLKKTSLFILLKSLKNILDNKKLEPKLDVYTKKYNLENFEFIEFKNDILKYLDLNKTSKTYQYKFANSSTESELYSSVYAVMTLGLFDEVKNLNIKDKDSWSNYILSFQKENGLFIDDYLESPLSNKIHYWGWFHLLPHLIIALDYLDIKPKYDFKFLYDIFEQDTVEEWLDSRDWKENYLAVSNEIMNITVLLQYSRDTFNNELGKEYADRILLWLKTNQIDKKTGLWGNKTSRSSLDISKAVKTAYHFIPMFVFDDDLEGINIDNIIKYTLQTQNSFGTYGPCCLTDGCEDIDSLYLLTQLPITNEFKSDVESSVKIFFDKVFTNMNDDGGFVFQRLRPFQYADSKLKSNIDESNMFGTWFRTLSIAYACQYLNIENDFKFSNVSGYQFLKEYN